VYSEERNNKLSRSLSGKNKSNEHRVNIGRNTSARLNTIWIVEYPDGGYEEIKFASILTNPYYLKYYRNRNGLHLGDNARNTVFMRSAKEMNENERRYYGI
jgi:hypothetical protein